MSSHLSERVTIFPFLTTSIFDMVDFLSLLEVRGQSPQKGFGLAHYDLNANNILVDRSFKILAIIDWDSVIAVPDAALYRVPFLLGMDCPVPGGIETHPAIIKRRQLCQRFTAVVEAVGGENDDGHLLRYAKGTVAWMLERFNSQIMSSSDPLQYFSGTIFIQTCLG